MIQHYIDKMVKREDHLHRIIALVNVWPSSARAKDGCSVIWPSVWTLRQIRYQTGKRAFPAPIWIRSASFVGCWLLHQIICLGWIKQQWNKRWIWMSRPFFDTIEIPEKKCAKPFSQCWVKSIIFIMIFSPKLPRLIARKSSSLLLICRKNGKKQRECSCPIVASKAFLYWRFWEEGI